MPEELTWRRRRLAGRPVGTVCFLALALLASICLSSCGERPKSESKAPPVTGVLIDAEGMQDIRIAASDCWLAAGVGAMLLGGDTVWNSADSSMQVMLGGGAKMTVSGRACFSLNAGEGKVPRIELTYGGVRLEGPRRERATIGTPACAVTATSGKTSGADLRVTVEPGGATGVVVASGSAEVENGAGKVSASAKGGAVCEPGEPPGAMPAAARPAAADAPGYSYFVNLQAGPYFRNEATRERTAEEAADKLSVAPDDRWAHVNLGRALLDSGDAAGARLQFVEALKSDPQFSQAYAGLGKVELLDGNWKEAFEAYSKARRAYRSSVEAVFGMGQTALGSDDLDQAEKWYKETLELEPGGSDPLVGLGVIRLLEGETTDSLRTLKDAIADDPPGTGAYHVMALAYLQGGDLVQAERCFRRALEARPDDSQVRNALGHACLRLGDSEDASAVFRGLVDSEDPSTAAVGYQNTGALKMLSWDVRGAHEDWTKSNELDRGRQAVLVDLGQADAALGDGPASAGVLSQAVTAEPYFWYLREWLARAMMVSGDYKRTITECDTAIELNPSAWISHLVRGIALADTGAHDESALEFEKAYALQPPGGLSASEKVFVGMSYARGKEYERALEEYRAAARTAPGYAPYRRLIGDALASLKRHEDALEHYDRAIELDRSDVKTYQAKADLLSFLGRRDDAIDLLEQAARTNLEDVGSRVMLAEYLLKDGDVDAALAECLRALELDPARGDAWFYLAQTYERMEMAAEAREAYAKAVELCQGNPAWKTLYDQAVIKI